MAWDSYSYATAWNAAAAAFINFETTFPGSRAPLTAPLRVPRGSVVNKAWDGSETVDGWIDIVLEQLGDPFGITLFANLTTYVTAVHGSWTGEDADMALKTLDIDGTFKYYNCKAHLPRLGEDFQFHPMKSAYITGLQLRYTVVNSYTPA